MKDAVKTLCFLNRVYVFGGLWLLEIFTSLGQFVISCPGNELGLAGRTCSDGGSVVSERNNADTLQTHCRHIADTCELNVNSNANSM